MSPHLRSEKYMSVPCSYCKASVGLPCMNVRNGRYARAGKTIAPFHWQRRDDAIHGRTNAANNEGGTK